MAMDKYMSRRKYKTCNKMTLFVYIYITLRIKYDLFGTDINLTFPILDVYIFFRMKPDCALFVLLCQVFSLQGESLNDLAV